MQVEEVVVTATKREQSVNKVPATVVAISGDSLIQAGVLDTRDLSKVATGFNYASNFYGNPVFSIRGVGLQDSSVFATPTVSLYLDEVPVPYPSMSQILDFDLQRVEVIKGPQGTLFGQNSTGGAISYVAAKPTDYFTAGVTASYDNFNELISKGSFQAG